MRCLWDLQYGQKWPISPKKNRILNLWIKSIDIPINIFTVKKIICFLEMILILERKKKIINRCFGEEATAGFWQDCQSLLKSFPLISNIRNSTKNYLWKWQQK